MPDKSAQAKVERALAEGRNRCTEIAKELGHTLGPWRFHPAGDDTVTQSSACTTCGAIAVVTRGRRDAVTISDEGFTKGGMDYALIMRCPNEIAQISHLDS
ncbi:MAG TPA: hypothetical protein VIJ28_04190 [Chloroflexota bacterium]|jgi:hypothetical protein